ncbi:competence protein ComFB [Sporanaerobium hydrogeniformans]|uniref:Competence protein ComFB n=1 Tax=Sporanaerobium hydrogeniformans TaxID=3072179 RepID=A0AC61DA70_9FIRM|nr:late competence development ComFB family protein [Sporanaerobium hydrogeniformans]PHV69576.1 competence protein ComFB [Sporanaerobium hydrogeniformans]
MDGVYNYMEHLVKKQLDEVLKRYECCKCPQCKRDMYAYALNLLPAKYVTSLEGEAFTKLEMLDASARVKLITVTTEAVHTVIQNVRHIEA